MSNSKDPIGFMGKTNAGVLLAVTPEYSQIKAIHRAGAQGRGVDRHLIGDPGLDDTIAIVSGEQILMVKAAGDGAHRQ